MRIIKSILTNNTNWQKHRNVFRNFSSKVHASVTVSRNFVAFYFHNGSNTALVRMTESIYTKLLLCDYCNYTN